MRILICFFMISLSSCANHAPQFLNQSPFWNDKTQRFGVIIGNIAEPSSYKHGHINFSGKKNNDSHSLQLNKYLKTLDISNLTDIALDITRQLKNKGLDAKFLSETTAIKMRRNSDIKTSGQQQLDYNHLRSGYDIDKLVVIDLARIGTIRNYYGFVPVNEPQGLSQLDAYVINLNNKQLEWKKSIIKKAKNKTSIASMKQQFEGITKAIYQAFDLSKNSLIEHFSE